MTIERETVTVPREALRQLRRVAEMEFETDRLGSVMIANWIIQDLAAAPPPTGEGGDQVEVWAQRLYESNAFYASSRADPDDGGWSDMAPNDGGIRDLHMDMAKAAKAIWDHEDAAPTPLLDGQGSSAEGADTQPSADVAVLDKDQRKAIERAAMDAGCESWRHCRLAMVDGEEIVGYPAFSRADMAELARLYREDDASQQAAVSTTSQPGTSAASEPSNPPPSADRAQRVRDILYRDMDGNTPIGNTADAILQALSQPAQDEEGDVDQVQVWAKALYDTNAFYRGDRMDWSEMASPDGGIRDLHTEMAVAAMLVWASEDDHAPAQDEVSNG